MVVVEAAVDMEVAEVVVDMEGAEEAEVDIVEGVVEVTEVEGEAEVDIDHLNLSFQVQTSNEILSFIP